MQAYFESLNQKDMVARGWTNQSNSDYASAYLNGLRNPNAKERAALETATLATPLNTFIPFIPWRFKIFPKELEFGYPHTHGDTIFLPEGFIERMIKDAYSFRKTLIHEKVHVFQRMRPFETNKLILDGWGFRVAGFKEKVWEGTAIRSNPDLNGLVYIDEQGGVISSAYASNGHEIVDSRDHPFEMMAYLIADLLMDGHSSSPMLQPYEPVTRAFLQKL